MFYRKKTWFCKDTLLGLFFILLMLRVSADTTMFSCLILPFSFANKSIIAAENKILTNSSLLIWSVKLKRFLRQFRFLKATIILQDRQVVWKFFVRSVTVFVMIICLYRSNNNCILSFLATVGTLWVYGSKFH